MRKSIRNLLKVGKCYFRLGYYDRNLSVPFIESYFFLGPDLYPDATGYWFFQSAQEYLDGLPSNDEANCEGHGVIGLSDDDLEDIVDWDGLIEELSENKKMQDQGKFLSQRI